MDHLSKLKLELEELKSLTQSMKEIGNKIAKSEASSSEFDEYRSMVWEKADTTKAALGWAIKILIDEGIIDPNFSIEPDDS